MYLPTSYLRKWENTVVFKTQVEEHVARALFSETSGCDGAAQPGRAARQVPGDDAHVWPKCTPCPPAPQGIPTEHPGATAEAAEGGLWSTGFTEGHLPCFSRRGFFYSWNIITVPIIIWKLKCCWMVQINIEILFGVADLDCVKSNIVKLTGYIFLTCQKRFAYGLVPHGAPISALFLEWLGPRAGRPLLCLVQSSIYLLGSF